MKSGFDLILQLLDRAYAIRRINRLDKDLADILDYTWNEEVSVEIFISGFHTRMVKISVLNLDVKLNRYFLLQQAGVDYDEKHSVNAAASGSYEAYRIIAALRNINRITIPPNATYASSSIGLDIKADTFRHESICSGGNGRYTVRSWRKESTI